MVDERITDGKRIAQLLSSELDGRDDGTLESVAVTNADTDVEPTVDGDRVYDVELASDGDVTRIARVFAHEDRARVELETSQERAVEEAERLELRTRLKASQPPRTLLFVESGAAVKRATDVVRAVVRGELD
ncbi:hypothetical protein [Natronobacterium gregoryi]|uniref:DUF7993 domain-containing protein n=2 Tax=Natronobacterium gregoryi TaxID=44930 RepID=L0ALR0_NATGS|nr:hypothetical protein [Natronobacterium gregoryi]AFZ74833.1 hypothetical protein Natgr_3729 [Natronobacterium gregoryi SP2]ELY65878.1 hypothetical protein C490_13416 [Natronobacterium gregoryi SP2]PLK17884.1 hypothetical protein CYV19_18805 [Natronobacterium gregoryi SP2]SFJ74291.1 hypothetical protein SAMN05443661_1723 [Natronobacterium gregoryi]